MVGSLLQLRDGGCTDALYSGAALLKPILSLLAPLSLSGLISRELALGSGVASHNIVPADSVRLPVQVQQG